MDNEEAQAKNDQAPPEIASAEQQQQQPEDDEGSSKSSASGGQRYYEHLLNDMECNLMFLDEVEEYLPELFDVQSVKKELKHECKLCEQSFSIMGNPRHHCRKCGASVCDLCSQTQRRLSKRDKNKHRVCDMCDHMISNTQFRKKLDTDIQRKENMSEEVQSKVTEMQSRLVSVQSETSKYKKILQEKQNEVAQKEQQVQSKLKVNSDRLQTIEQINKDLQTQLETVETNNTKVKEDIEAKQKQQKDLEDRKVQLRQDIQQQNQQLKAKKSAMLQVKNLDYEKVFVEQKVQNQGIDDNMVANWRKEQADTTEQDTTDMGDDNKILPTQE